MDESICFDGPYGSWSEQCFYCRWYRSFSAKTMTETCEAFPEGIPLAFWNDQERHDQPHPNDNGIQFAPFTPDEIAAHTAQTQAFHAELREGLAKLPPELRDPPLFTEDDLR